MPRQTILLIGSNIHASGPPIPFRHAQFGDHLRKLDTVEQAIDYLGSDVARQDGVSRFTIVLLGPSVGALSKSKLVMWMRTHELFENVPIVALTDTEAHSSKPFDLGLKSYMIQCGDTDTLLDVVSRYWTRTNPGADQRA